MELTQEPTGQARTSEGVSRWSRMRRRGGQAAALQSAGVAVIFAALIVYFSLRSSQFLTTQNGTAILDDISVLGIVAVGQAIVLIGGGFDLSVGGVLALGSVEFVSLSNAGHSPLVSGIIVLIAVGVAAGLVNGLLVAVVKINPLIATLGMMSITGGIASAIANGVEVPLKNLGTIGLADTPIGNIPNYVWLTALIYLVVGGFLLRTTVGRNVYAIGSNREASRLAGMRTNLYTVGMYVACATLAALAGIVTSAQLLASSPGAGADITLESITAVVLGGATLSGGEGGIAGTLLGVLVLGTLADGLALLAVNPFYRDIITGIVLLLAVGISRLRTMREAS